MMPYVEIFSTSITSIIQLMKNQLNQYFTSITEAEFNDRFTDEGWIGKGVSSKVIKYWDKHHNRHVAIKKILNSVVRHFSLIVVRQSQALKFRHENLVTFYQCLAKQQQFRTNYLFVTEYCQIGNLQENIEQIRQLPTSKLYQICLQIAKGLQYLHKKDIMHRDLKPENIFLTHDSKGQYMVKIGDYGSSKQSQAQNTTGVGTRLYADPETLNQSYTKKCDIYSMGLIFYYLFTGKNLFEEFLDSGKFQFQEKKKEFFGYLKGKLEEEGFDIFKQSIIGVCLQPETQRQSIENIIKFLQDQIENQLKNKSEDKKSTISENQIETVPQLNEKKSQVSKKIQSNIEKVQSQITEKEQSQIHKKDKKSLSKIKKKQSFLNSQKSFHATAMKYMLRINKNKQTTQKTFNLAEKSKRFLNRLKILTTLKFQDNQNLSIFLLLCLNFMYLKEWIQKQFKIKDKLFEAISEQLNVLQNMIKPFHENVKDNIDLFSPEISEKLKLIIRRYNEISYSHYHSHIVDYLRKSMKNISEVENLIEPRID